MLFSNMNNLGQSCALLPNNPDRILTVSVTEIHIHVLRTCAKKTLQVSLAVRVCIECISWVDGALDTIANGHI